MASRKTARNRGTGRKKGWSYNAGEKGRNWVRAYEDRPGKYYLECFEEEEQPGTVGVVRKRRRVLLRDVADPEAAKAYADRVAAKSTEIQAPPTSKITLARLLTRYLQEVTLTKGKSKQGHDRRAARMFARLLGQKKAGELDRRDWDRFVQLRRTGGIAGLAPVRERQIAYDLKFLIAVLTWGTGLQEHGRSVLDYNPWSAERRRANRMVMPKEQSPRRPSMTDPIRDALIEHSPHWQFTLALIVGRYTVSRNSSVRHLRWSDVDLRAGTVRWRQEHDKSGREVVVPLLPEAIEALRGAPRGIGGGWVFPSETEPSRPTPRDTFQTWMRRAKERWLETIEDRDELERMREAVRGLGFHGLKRAGVRDPWFRGLDDKMKEKLSRTNHKTLIEVYDDVELDEMREAMRRRRES